MARRTAGWRHAQCRHPGAESRSGAAREAAGRRRPGRRAGLRGRSERLRHPAVRSRLRSGRAACGRGEARSEEHTSELQSLMRISYAVFCLKKKIQTLIRISSADYISTKINKKLTTKTKHTNTRPNNQHK